jgi:serine protease inhibitor
MKKLEDFKKIADANLDKLDMSQEAKLRLINAARNSRKRNFRKFGLMGVPVMAALIAFILFFTGVFPPNTSLRVHAEDLMKGITPQQVETVKLSEQFLQSTADFSVELFKKSYTKGKNSLISPTSVYLALGMTANGADGNTLKEFEALLGNKNISIKELNSYYKSLADTLTKDQSSQVNITDSIWYSNEKDLNIEKDFLQTNADYYSAAAYKADFTSKKTVKDINDWVKANTGDKIDKIIDKIDADTIMYLINTIYFDAQWENIYYKEAVRKGDFKLTPESKKTVEFMHSTESVYLKDVNAQGFIKPYKDGKYSFVALLPNEGVSIDNYVSSLTGEGFINILNNKSKDTVFTALPKFKFDYNVNLVEPLKKLGLNTCFIAGKANFSKMENSKEASIYVSDVIHKTFISVDTQGTKAGAATRVDIAKGGIEVQQHTIILDRPFLYAIVDNETKLPLFIGTMMNPEF